MLQANFLLQLQARRNLWVLWVVTIMMILGWFLQFTSACISYLNSWLMVPINLHLTAVAVTGAFQFMPANPHKADKAVLHVGHYHLVILGNLLIREQFSLQLFCCMHTLFPVLPQAMHCPIFCPFPKQASMSAKSYPLRVHALNLSLVK